MAANLDYLDPTLIPLAEKIMTYLEAEKELHRAHTAAINLRPAAPRPETEFEQRPATGSFDQPADEVAQRLENLRDDLAVLRGEIIGMLPVRNEFIKVNLGYGPSRVGAFHAPGAPADEPVYELRIVQ